MNDNEVIKALESISYGGHSCVKCKFGITKGDERCGLKGCNIARKAIDIINRQKAEIERLMPFGTQVEVSKKIEAEIKYEAIKEFAERLRSHYDGYDDYDDIYAHHIRDDMKWDIRRLSHTYLKARMELLSRQVISNAKELPEVCNGQANEAVGTTECRRK